MELESEAPGYNEDWPSDIHFLLDGIPIAMWTAPGDYGTQRGIFTPDWWYEDWNQYGLLKALQINHRGTFIDGVRKSDVTIDTFGYTDKSTIHLRSPSRRMPSTSAVSPFLDDPLAITVRTSGCGSPTAPSQPPKGVVRCQRTRFPPENNGRQSAPPKSPWPGFRSGTRSWAAALLFCYHIIMEVMTEAAFFPSLQSLPVLASVVWYRSSP